MAITHCFAGVPVSDFRSARSWYERLFGRAPDLVPHENEVAWQVVGAGWVYVVRDADRAGRALLTLLVDDLELQIAELAERGLATSEIETLPGKARKAVIADPDGNSVTFAQPQAT
jgi:catechol 2,3-dioxygenase-like lactoylglutathione lyase family enzyme